MNRRDVITVLGGTALTWPVALRAQRPAMPLIGYLNGASAAEFAHLRAAFLEGLAEAGFTEGRNATIEYRYADGRYERLPTLATDLVNRKPSVIVATAGTPTVRAAKAATSTIPIAFVIGGDPVRFGIVASLNRPGGNITGITLVGVYTVAKRLGVLLELVPAAGLVAVLANPSNPISAAQITELQAAAQTLGARPLLILNATSETEFASAFAAMDEQRVSALLVASDPFFDDRRAQIVALGARHKIPACYTRREFVAEGGLVSYGPDLPDAYRQAGVYTGRILKGEKPADLPVLQPTKFEMVINVKAAQALGLTIPQALLLRADEVIR